MVTIDVISEEAINSKVCRLRKLGKIQNVNITHTTDYEAIIERIRKLRPNILLIEQKKHDEFFRVIKEIQDQKLVMYLLVVGFDTSYQMMRQLLRLNINDFVLLPCVDQELVSAILDAKSYVDYRLEYSKSTMLSARRLADAVTSSTKDLEGVMFTAEDFLLSEKCSMPVDIMCQRVRVVRNIINRRMGNRIIGIPDTRNVCGKITGSKSLDESVSIFCKYFITMSKLIAFYYPHDASESTKSAVTYILDHIVDRLNLNQVSEACGLSANYLSHLFKKEMGLSIVEFINRVRITMVKKLLQESKLPISEIAERVGYEDRRYMERVFRKFCDCSLVEYRRKEMEASFFYIDQLLMGNRKEDNSSAMGNMEVLPLSNQVAETV